MSCLILAHARLSLVIFQLCSCCHGCILSSRIQFPETELQGNWTLRGKKFNIWGSKSVTCLDGIPSSVCMCLPWNLMLYLSSLFVFGPDGAVRVEVCWFKDKNQSLDTLYLLLWFINAVQLSKLAVMCVLLNQRQWRLTGRGESSQVIFSSCSLAHISSHSTMQTVSGKKSSANVSLKQHVNIPANVSQCV